jgi:hypothetical protein
VTLSGLVDLRDSRKARAGVLSVALHVVLVLVILAGGRHEGLQTGDALVSMPLLLEEVEADRGDVEERPLAEPAAPTPPSAAQLDAAIAKLAPAPSEALIPDLADFAPPEVAPVQAEDLYAIRSAAVAVQRAMSEAEKAELSKRLEKLAEQSLENSRSKVSWEQDGRQYSAELVREPANDGTALEHVTARVTTSDRGRYLTTLVNLRRLAFSQFTQMVNFWDPTVQLHDDEIVGRFHSNSQVKLKYDSSATPMFLGKATTSARSFDMESHGRKRDAEIFRGGKETRAGRIELPESVQPFEWAPRDEDARIHEFTADAHIRFYPDGSYSWRARDAQASTVNRPSDVPVYFVAAPNVTLYVQGVVGGRVLVYSPSRIVIEGNLTYANDPRGVSHSKDFVGLVSDRYVEVAPPGVTGPGDLEIDAAIYAGRRFVVTNIDQPRSATLRIYGSLAAGSLTATEPRYATKIEYDDRFERERPPGFPSTNRYEAAAWDGQWTASPPPTLDDSP